MFKIQINIINKYAITNIPHTHTVNEVFSTLDTPQMIWLYTLY